ncbi:MAG: hypothetical protein WC353_03800 [Candidatus Peribacter sp.]|jgi:hypothetical protein
MIDMEALAQAIRKDSIAIQARRKELPESKRPNDLAGLQRLRVEIQGFVEKNDRYQRQMDKVRHENNDYGPRQGRNGDALVKPAYEVKTALQEFPWPFDQNLREFIKIFHHCYTSLIEQLKKDLNKVSAEIECGLVSLPSRRQMKSIRKEMGRITATFQWLQEHWRVPFLGQVDSSGREDMSFMEVPPGVPGTMNEFAIKLTAASDRQNKLEEKVRGSDANRTAKTAVWISCVSLLIAAISLIFSVGGKIAMLLRLVLERL